MWVSRRIVVWMDALAVIMFWWIGMGKCDPNTSQLCSWCWKRTLKDILQLANFLWIVLPTKAKTWGWQEEREVEEEASPWNTSVGSLLQSAKMFATWKRVWRELGRVTGRRRSVWKDVIFMLVFVSLTCHFVSLNAWRWDVEVEKYLTIYIALVSHRRPTWPLAVVVSSIPLPRATQTLPLAEHTIGQPNKR